VQVPVQELKEGFKNESDMDPAFKNFRAKMRVKEKAELNRFHSNEVGKLPSTANKDVIRNRQTSWRLISDIKQSTLILHSRKMQNLDPPFL
jgi:hypothetical protein